MTFQPTFPQQIDTLLLRLHYSDGKGDLIHQTSFQFQTLDTIKDHIDPSKFPADRRIQLALDHASFLKAMSNAEQATNLDHFKASLQIAEKHFKELCPLLRYKKNEELERFFKRGQNASDLRPLPLICHDAKGRMGYGVIQVLFNHQAEAILERRSTKLGFAKLAREMFGYHGKAARIKFLNYLAFFAHFGLLSIEVDANGGKRAPIMIELTPKGIAWWINLSQRARLYDAPFKKRVLEIEAEIKLLQASEDPDGNDPDGNGSGGNGSGGNGPRLLCSALALFAGLTWADSAKAEDQKAWGLALTSQMQEAVTDDIGKVAIDETTFTGLQAWTAAITALTTDEALDPTTTGALSAQSQVAITWTAVQNHQATNLDWTVNVGGYIADAAGDWNSAQFADDASYGVMMKEWAKIAADVKGEPNVARDIAAQYAGDGNASDRLGGTLPLDSTYKWTEPSTWEPFSTFDGGASFYSADGNATDRLGGTKPLLMASLTVIGG